MKNEIVRGNYYNSRTQKASWTLSPPSNVVVDGIPAFLSVLKNSFFQRSNILCVVDRASHREELSALTDVVNNLNNWYSADEELVESWCLPVMRSIDIHAIRRRGR